VQSSNSDPLERVRTGMHVVDAAGEDIGTVEQIRMGDPEAATTAGNEDTRQAPLDLIGAALGGEGEPDTVEPLRSRLIRTGYLKLAGAHLMEADRYVPGDCVRGVANDRVELSVRREALARET
jgi:hypothetical protein